MFDLVTVTVTNDAAACSEPPHLSFEEYICGRATILKLLSDTLFQADDTMDTKDLENINALLDQDVELREVELATQ